jgi:hypothetical protein
LEEGVEGLSICKVRGVSEELQLARIVQPGQSSEK